MTGTIRRPNHSSAGNTIADFEACFGHEAER